MNKVVMIGNEHENITHNLLKCFLIDSICIKLGYNLILKLYIDLTTIGNTQELLK